jgi:SAM-dependent methyltransferase
MAREDTCAAGERYEPYVGRWSRLVAREFVAGLALPAGSDWLDVGCGTGALTRTIAEYAAPRSVRGIDRSPEFIAYARTPGVDARVRFDVGDAEALPVADSTVDAAVSALVLNFLARPDVALREMQRAVRAGGIVAIYVWDYADGMQLMRRFWDAAGALDPGARQQDEGVRFPLCRPEPLRRLFTDAALDDVDVASIDVPTVFRDFDDYWSPFLGGQGPAPGYAMSLDDTRRDALRERLRSNLPTEPDGSIRLTARAWCARGRVRR